MAVLRKEEQRSSEISSLYCSPKTAVHSAIVMLDNDSNLHAIPH